MVKDMLNIQFLEHKVGNIYIWTQIGFQQKHYTTIYKYDEIKNHE